MNKQDLTTGLNKDLKDLTTYEAALTVLKAGMKVENMTLEGAEVAVEGLKACIAHKEAMIAKLDAIEAAAAEAPAPTTTEAPSFNEALAGFVSQAQAVMDEHKAKHYPNIPRDVLTVKMGRRYAKIIRTSECGNHRSVHCFVDRTNGDVLKAASWKAPAKHARGNIYRADNGAGSMTPYGAAYLR
jgi:hypothetical protein